jgi:hypothetical protein
MGGEKDQNQGNTGVKEKAPVTIMSRLFSLRYRTAEYLPPYDREVGDIDPPNTRRVYDPNNPGDPRDGGYRNEPLPPTWITIKTKMVKSRWIYIFQKLGDKITWYAEYRASDTGSYHPVDMKKARDKERYARPEPSKEPSFALTLPHTINGKRAYYTFYISGTRLALKSIKALETEEYWKLLRVIDLNDPKMFSMDNTQEKGFEPKPDQQSALDIFDFVTVDDHLLYGISLNRVMQQLRDRAVSWVSVTTDMKDKAQIQRTQNRLKKKMLAEVITSIMAHDRGDKLSLKDEFSQNGEILMRRFLSDYDAKITQKLKDVDIVARDLAAWMDSKIMKFVNESYTILEDVDIVPFQTDDFPAFLAAYSQCIDRLSETGPGKVFLQKALQDKAYFLHPFLLEDGQPSGPKFQAWRKGYAAGFSVWKEILMVALEERKGGGQAVEKLVKSINNLARVPLFKVEFRTLTHLVSVDEGVRVGRNGRQTKIRYTEITYQPDGWRNWITADKFTGFLTRVTVVVEVLNLGLALEGLLEATGTEDKIWAAIGLVGSALDTVTAFGVLMKMKEMTLRKVSMVSAVIDAVTAVRDASSMVNRGDYSAAVGYGMVSGGSALIAIGCAVGIAGAHTMWAGVGVVLEVLGAILVAAGWLLSWLTSESDLEVFVKHCVWGENYRSGSGSESWSDGKFADWNEDKPGGLDHQVNALLNLTASFTLFARNDDYGKLGIHLGLMQPRSKLYIRFDSIFNKKEHHAELMVDFQSRTMKQIRGDSADLNLVEFAQDAVSVKISPEPRFEMQQLQKCDCMVRLDLYGDGSHWIPSSGAWVPFRLRRLGEMITKDRVRSSKY